MQVIIVYDEYKKETLENAESFEWFVKFSLKDNDADVNFEESKIEIETMSANVFDFKCPAWFN